MYFKRTITIQTNAGIVVFLEAKVNVFKKNKAKTLSTNLTSGTATEILLKCFGFEFKLQVRSKSKNKIIFKMFYIMRLTFEEQTYNQNFKNCFWIMFLPDYS